MPDCAIAGGRPVPDARLISRLADDLAGGWLTLGGPPAAQLSDLLELLAGVSDGRPGQGRDHPVAAVLALAAAAVVAGSRSFTAIAGWAADVPAGILEDLCRRCGGRAARCRAAVEGHDLAGRHQRGHRRFRRGNRHLADAAGQRRRESRLPWSRRDDAPLIPVRVDGKTVRGARNAAGSQVHLLAALAGVRGVVAAQTEVGAKTNEIPMIIPLLDGLDLDQAVVTADALHCQRATAIA